MLDDDFASLGFEIREVLRVKNIQAKQVADAIGISPQYMNDIVHDRKVPINPILDQLIDYLNLDRDYCYFIVGRLPSDIKTTLFDDWSLAQACFQQIREKE